MPGKGVELIIEPVSTPPGEGCWSARLMIGEGAVRPRKRFGKKNPRDASWDRRADNLRC
jgi:hypothetical protein